VPDSAVICSKSESLFGIRHPDNIGNGPKTARLQAHYTVWRIERLKCSIQTFAPRNSGLRYRTANAVTWLRDNFEKQLNVDDLAKMAGMSRSTLHHHFRELTAMSPLQFQKHRRLHAAERKCSKTNLTLQVQRLRSDTKAQANSIGSTRGFLVNRRSVTSSTPRLHFGNDVGLSSEIPGLQNDGRRVS
jgi:AraC-like DNA-binding protein